MLVYQRVYVHPPSTSRRPSQHEACGPAARCPTGGALRLHPEKLGFNTDGSEKKTRISPGKAVVDPTNMVFCWWLLLTPLKNISSSVGMMTFPTEWKVIKIHGSSHHQLGKELYISLQYHLCPGFGLELFHCWVRGIPCDPRISA